MYERIEVPIGRDFASIQKSVPRPKGMPPKREVEHEI
jgi:hypothetical protein